MKFVPSVIQLFFFMLENQNWKAAMFKIFNFCGLEQLFYSFPPFGVNPAAEFLNLSEILEVERYLFYRYYYQKNSTWGVYDKNNYQTYQFDGKSLLKDDISGALNIVPKFVCNGLIYSWTDALSFKKFMSSDVFRKAEVKNLNRKSELEKLATSVKEDDNHLLIIITPKK